MGGSDLRETVELIDSRIHQRWDPQQRHKAGSAVLASSFTVICFEQNFKIVKNMIWAATLSRLKETIIFNLLVNTTVCEHIKEL